MNSCPHQNPNELINDYPGKHSLRNNKVGHVYQYSILFSQGEDDTHISRLI